MGTLGLHTKRFIGATNCSRRYSFNLYVVNYLIYLASRGPLYNINLGLVKWSGVFYYHVVNYGHARCVLWSHVVNYGHARCVFWYHVVNYSHARCVFRYHAVNYGHTRCVFWYHVEIYGHARCVFWSHVIN